MKNNTVEVIIIGGSNAGLAAAMALGRALRKVLVIDSGHPCNAPTPFSHNFLTNDGRTPEQIHEVAEFQALTYPTVHLIHDVVTGAQKTSYGFSVSTSGGDSYTAGKLVFATGIRDIMPPIPGFAECWGKTVIHCPYCHGYEVKGVETGILANGETAFELAALISNWTNRLTVYTNGPSTLTKNQVSKLTEHSIAVNQGEIKNIQHTAGNICALEFADGSGTLISALYTRPAFEQHSQVPAFLGCEITDAGYIKTDANQRTTIPGVFACGDNTTRLRTVANAVAQGTLTGMVLNKEMIEENF
jgi:thioredoxin reductase